MSADNYGYCPRCKQNNDIALETSDSKNTLRECWDIGMDEDGEFYVYYHGKCQMCDFEFKFEKEIQVKI